MIDEQEAMNEFRIEAYDNYLQSMSLNELSFMINDLDKEELIGIIKERFGNDGKDDSTFDY